MSDDIWTEAQCQAYADGLRPMVRWDHARFAERIAQHIKHLPQGSVLCDIATGPGFLAIECGRRVPGLALFGQDQAAPMLAIAAKEAERAGLVLETVCCPAEELALGDATVDAVLCKQLLHEAADVDRTLCEMVRVLRPSGLAFVVDFDREGSWWAAAAVRMFITLRAGAALGRSFWRSKTQALAGDDVRARMLAAGFGAVEYQRAGFNYFMVAQKPPLPPNDN